MPKRLFSFLVIFFALLSAFSTDMSLYDYKSYDYVMVDKLTRLSGVIGPSSATPVTAYDLKLALDRVDVAMLSGRYKEEYNRLMAKFSATNDEFSFDGDIFIAPQVYLTVDQETIDPDDYFIPFSKRVPAGYGAVAFHFGDNLFLESSIEFINNKIIIGKDGIPYTSFDFIMSNRADNGVWNVVSTANPIQLYGSVPSMARGAVGNKWLSFIFGRSHHQMGSGYSGNMVIGDNYRYQEIAKLTAMSNPFTYTLDLTHFDAQDTTSSGWEINKSRFSGEQVLRLMHRLDVNILNKARIATNLGFLMYTDNIADMRLITPLFLVHNWYNFREGKTINKGDEANNIMSVEIEWLAIPRLRLGLQLVVDQFQMFWEEDDVPDAFGLMFNVSYLQTLNSGDIEYYAEGVYTAPNLYLNKKYDDADHTKNYNYDFALGYFLRDSDGDVAWSGHTFGPNALGIVLGANVDLYDYNFTVDSSLSYYAHGDIPFETQYFEEGAFRWQGTPEHRLDLKGEASWGFHKGLELIGGINFGFYWNYKHESGNFKFMPQGMLGLKYTII